MQQNVKLFLREPLARLDFLNLALDELSSSIQCALEIRNLTVGPIDPAIQTLLDFFCCIPDDIVDGVFQLNLCRLHFIPGLFGEVTYVTTRSAAGLGR